MAKDKYKFFNKRNLISVLASTFIIQSWIAVSISAPISAPLCSRSFDLPRDSKQVSSLDLNGIVLPNFKTDDLNTNYFLALLTKFKQKKVNANANISIYDSSINQEGQNVVYPTAAAPMEMLKYFPVQSYKMIRSEQQSDLLKYAKQTNLYIAKMQAGTGSSIIRSNYIARVKNISIDSVKLGAKGTDLQIPESKNHKSISIAEAQILQAARKEEASSYQSLHWTDLMSPETQNSISEIWKKLETQVTDKIHREQPIMQYAVPTLNEAGEATLNRVAPAGHGLFAFSALKNILREKNPTGKILVISNGEDLSGSPDPIIVGYMKKNKIPILMLTTDKTEIDLKGGQIAIATENQKGIQIPYITIVEHAQAEAAQQKALFEKLGLRSEDRKAAFNTNMVLLNYEVLSPLIKAEVKRVGENEFFNQIGPALIENWKSQKDPDGIERKYLQLEGAMGSMILNLDKYFRINHNKNVVGFVNIEREFRTQFFAPIKTAFDYYMQFYSDRFSFNAQTNRLVDHRPGYLPSVKLIDAPTKDKYYADVDNVLATFGGSSIRNIDNLTIEGRVTLNNVILIGNIQIINKTSEVINVEKYLELNPTLAQKYNGKWILNNQSIQIM